MPNALIVGGPNGAGKSTFAREYLRGRDELFLSADRIAAQLNPDQPSAARIEAGREFIRRLRRAVEAERDLVVESTLAGRGMNRMLTGLQDAGYRVRLVFLVLDSPDLCVQRVRERVQRGGHHVPREDVVRRYHRSIYQFWSVYRHRADQWYLFDNTDEQFRQVAAGEGGNYAVLDDALFDRFRERVVTGNE